METDLGRPVMSPDGKQLELMVFGDTYVANPNFTLNDHKNAVETCISTTASGFCSNHSSGSTDKYDQCLKLFAHIQPKANACTYFYASWLNPAWSGDLFHLQLFLSPATRKIVVLVWLAVQLPAGRNCQRLGTHTT